MLQGVESPHTTGGSMTTKIFYFTGTGNSLHAAKTIAAKIGGATVERILPRAAAASGQADTIGIVFPVYLHRPPQAVSEFVKNLSIKKGSYLFTVVTHNGEPGGAHKVIEKILRKKGAALDGAFNILMPGNSVIIADFTQGEEERARRLNALEAACDEIAGAVLHRAKIAAIADRPLPALKSAMMRNFMKGYRLQNKFNVDTALCNGCATCVKVCPEQNISLKSTPSWGEHCANCLACYHLCPRQAINIESYTKERLRYRHPQVKTAELYVCNDGGQGV